MRRRSVGVLIFGLLLWAVSVQAASPPISLHHTLEGEHQEGDVTVLDLKLHVENKGEAPLYFLSFNPDFPPVNPQDQTYSIDTLGPHQRVDLKVRLTVPSPEPSTAEQAVPRLLWRGSCRNEFGEPLEFIEISRQGGLQ